MEVVEQQNNYEDPQYIRYCYLDRKKKNKAIVILNDDDGIYRMYKLAKKGTEFIMGTNDEYSINWKCADPNCQSTLRSKRYDRNVNADFDIEILNNEHDLDCSVNKTAVVHALMREEMIERSGLLDAVYTEVYEDVKNEYLLQGYEPFIINAFPSQSTLKSSQSRENMVNLKCSYQIIILLITCYAIYNVFIVKLIKI